MLLQWPLRQLRHLLFTCGPSAARAGDCVAGIAQESAGDCVAGIAEESAGDYDAGKVCEELSLTCRCRSTHALSDVKVRLYVPTVMLIEYTYSRLVAPCSWH